MSTPPPEKIRSKQKLDKPVGEVSMGIAGMQFYDAPVHTDEVVHFVREPENEHDGNAIRVENADFHPVGHLPKERAAWIAPLIDSGRLRISGCVPDTPPEDQYETRIRVKFFLASKGMQMLKPFSPCANGEEALHNAVLAAWKQAKELSAADQVLAVAKKLERALDRRSLPETRLALSLFEVTAAKVCAKTERRASKAMRERIRAFRVGKGKHFENLTLFPLFGSNGHKADYILLSEALKKGTAEVTEVSDSGSVPELKVVNRDDRPILIPEGEIVMGGKQHRTVNITIIVEVREEFVIPVTCVEQGRWDLRERAFRSGNFATPGIRSVKAESVHREIKRSGRAMSDQGGVWDHVAASLNASETQSETVSLADGFEKAKKELKEYARHLTLEKGACGFLIASGRSITGVEFFDSPATLRKLWSRLSRGYFFEGAFHHEKSAKTPRKNAESFMKRLSRSVRTGPKNTNWSNLISVEMKTHVGGGLLYKDRICHLSAFQRR